MVITLSLTVPHFACQLAFILFSFFPPLFFHPAYTVRFLGVLFFLVPPCVIHHSWNQFYYPASPSNSYRANDKKEICIYSLRRQHPTFTNLFLRSHSRDFHSSRCFPLPAFKLFSPYSLILSVKLPLTVWIRVLLFATPTCCCVTHYLV